jgi:GNAT superfamily N-acetyltransferase
MNQVLVRQIEESEIAEGMQVLVDSFQDEPFNTAVYDFSEPDTKQRYLAVSIAKARLYRDAGYPMLVALQGDRVVGTAVVTNGNGIPISKMVRSAIPVAANAIPLLRRLHWRRGLKLARAMKHSQQLDKPFLTLEALAVRPEHQGRGIGKMLFQEVHRMSEERATGTYLFTASEVNRQIFEHLGYETVEARAAAGLTVYHMFRRNPARS